MNKKELRGFIYIIIGSALWGLGGVIGQYLIKTKGFETTWLVSCRLLIGGLIMTASLIARKKFPRDIFTNKKRLYQFLAFAILGAGASQFSYYLTVQEANASTATILQYTFPIIILVYSTLIYQKIPETKTIILMVCVILGTILIATKGEFNKLSISKIALFWGLISAIAAANYTILSQPLTKKYGSFALTGTSFLFCGILALPFINILKIPGKIDSGSIIAFILIIICSTILAYTYYLEGVKLAGPLFASIGAAFEPVSAALASALVFHTSFNLFEILGFIVIIGSIILMNKQTKKI